MLLKYEDLLGYVTKLTWYDTSKSLWNVSDISLTKFNIEFNGNVSFITIDVISILSLYKMFVLFLSCYQKQETYRRQICNSDTYIWDSLMYSFARKEKPNGYINTKRTFLFIASDKIGIVNIKTLVILHEPTL